MSLSDYVRVPSDFLVMSDNLHKFVLTERIEDFIEILLNDKKKGCGKEFLDESGDWELMCGKHIWTSPGVVKEYRLCEDCIDEIKWLKDQVGDVLLGDSE